MLKIQRIIGSLLAPLRRLSFGRKIALVIALVLVISAGLHFFKGGGTKTAVETTRLRQVQIASVGDLANGTVPLPLIGEVKSVNEAEIRSESSGSITRLYHRLGDYVSAGTIIAEIENSGERAALLQAEGLLESAKAGVQKTDTLFTESKSGTIDTIRSVYSSNDDLVFSKLDAFFSNPRSNLPHFNILASDSGLINKVQSSRVAMNQLLANEATRGMALTGNSDLKAEIAKAIEETRTVKNYIDDISTLLNGAIPSAAFPQATIDANIAITSAARTLVSASLASLSGAQQALTSGEQNATTPGGVSSASATIKQAQGAYDAAASRLEKTIIRSPIGGTLNSLSLNLGDFVSSFQQIAIVSNNGALEIVARITPEDRTSIAVGARVKIEGKYDGVVTRIAPAVDPTTKKIEVKIGLSGAANFTNGESVHLDITRTPRNAGPLKTIAIPVSAIKINSDSSVVFTVDDVHHLVAHPIKTGGLIGDKIQILEGVTPDMKIVEDARGLKDGQEVEVQ